MVHTQIRVSLPLSLSKVGVWLNLVEQKRRGKLVPWFALPFQSLRNVVDGVGYLGFWSSGHQNRVRPIPFQKKNTNFFHTEGGGGGVGGGGDKRLKIKQQHRQQQHTVPSLRRTVSNGYVGTGRNNYMKSSNNNNSSRIYERLESCLVIPPPTGKKPRAIVKFLGGAFIGAVPEVTYSYLLELLANEGYLIISVPYNVTFDHAEAAREIYERFIACLDRISTSGLPSANLTATELFNLPLYSVGHRYRKHATSKDIAGRLVAGIVLSNGALLQLLTGSYFSEKIAKANAIISFNNRPATEAVPYFEQSIIFNIKHTSFFFLTRWKLSDSMLVCGYLKALIGLPLKASCLFVQSSVFLIFSIKIMASPMKLALHRFLETETETVTVYCEAVAFNLIKFLNVYRIVTCRIVVLWQITIARSKLGPLVSQMVPVVESSPIYSMARNVSVDSSSRVSSSYQTSGTYPKKKNVLKGSLIQVNIKKKKQKDLELARGTMIHLVAQWMAALSGVDQAFHEYEAANEQNRHTQKPEEWKTWEKPQEEVQEEFGIEDTERHTVVEISSSKNNITPKRLRNFHGKQKEVSNFKKMAILAFSDFILLRSANATSLIKNVMLLKVCSESSINILSPIITPKTFSGSIKEIVCGILLEKKFLVFGKMVFCVVGCDVCERKRDAWKTLLDMAAMIPDYDQEAVVSLTKFVDQLPSVLNQVRQGISEFKPTPSENRDCFKNSYNVEHTLLVKFNFDTIDETDLLEETLKPRVESIGGTLEKVLLTGNHVTPCVQPEGVLPLIGAFVFSLLILHLEFIIWYQSIKNLAWWG
ncbi:hypothetical protein HYC85_030984 [Camellia sinensis]|uniref:Uncharacterized protein n=1 Tax=Camellia sinensis TaxID=4442 RepID=A0A7J7FQC8_CAMSI|nr:hypothetical protein HYC85_030984 [Camellia sinensis]